MADGYIILGGHERHACSSILPRPECPWSFKGVEWTRDKIIEVRDLLAPWDHNIALPHGVYTAACDDYYPAHREIMRVVRERLGGDFSGRRIVDIGCLEGYFSIECALQGAEVLGIDGKLLNVRKCEFVRSVLGVNEPPSPSATRRR